MRVLKIFRVITPAIKDGKAIGLMMMSRQKIATAGALSVKTQPLISFLTFIFNP